MLSDIGRVCGPLHTVWSLLVAPRLARAPALRSEPHARCSWAIHTTNTFSIRSIRKRPKRRALCCPVILMGTTRVVQARMGSDVASVAISARTCLPSRLPSSASVFRDLSLPARALQGEGQISQPLAVVLPLLFDEVLINITFQHFRFNVRNPCDC